MREGEKRRKGEGENWGIQDYCEFDGF